MCTEGLGEAVSVVVVTFLLTAWVSAVEVLALLCERYDAAPPRLATVRGWHEKYLAAFDAGKIKASASFKTARRKVIENTFRWLEGLAESYHES